MTTLMPSTQISFDEAGFKTVLESNTEPSWLTELRQDAWKTFNELQWPNNRQEEWMRTDIRLFKLDKFALKSDSSSDGLPELVLSDGVDLAGSVSSLNSQAGSAAELAAEYQKKGVIFGTISDLIGEHGDLIKKYLFQAVDYKTDRFAALHAAMWTNSVFLYVPRNVVLDKPVHISSQLTDGGSDLRHTLIVIEEGAEATVLAESNSAADANGFHLSLIHI